MRWWLVTLYFFPFVVCAQLPDEIYYDNIRTVKLFAKNNQLSYPIIPLGSVDQLELHFDDMDGYVKNYSYTFQLCNADWKPNEYLGPFDYIKGFTQQRLSQYRVSSIATQEYVHYQASIPDRNCMPSKSGNYLLKVFLNGDTSRLAFTKRLLVVDQKADIGAQVQQPFNARYFQTHQKVQLVVNRTKLDVLNPQQQVKTVILQNFRWDNTAKYLQPTFVKQNTLEYNTENDALFAGGKEFRWVDLRSFRFKSERIDSNNLNTKPFYIVLRPDPERTTQRYLYIPDLNGFYEITTTDLINPWWQGDYAKVKFTFVPKNNQPYPDREVFLAGELTGYKLDQRSKMEYNAELGVYQKELVLKQGYYSYTYVTKGIREEVPTVEQTDGNYWETENDYLVLVYYRSLSGRHDELVGVTTVNSRSGRGL
ncbi:MAG TPA: DUF5103 domain-containing protein [Chitinophagaceae bacterium]